MNVTPMQPSRWLWLALSIGLLAIILLAVLGRNSQDQTPVAEAVRLDAGPEAGAVKRAAYALPPMAAGAGPDVSPDSPDSVDAQEAASIRQREQYWQTLAAQYSTEQSDPKWSAQHEYSLTAIALSDLIDRSSVTPEDLSIDCKSNVCRIVADFSSTTSASDWATLFTASVGNNMLAGSVRQVTGPSGNPRIEIYGRGR